ncbi:adenylate/guanylate cyclase domain-containing protein [Kovacikia minuta CCNUW1]|uniref:adenylate/guanylate cyclase domain-containing protein n=1 Tax=Kovacikia minuta TaxID=2931930 RepID=UPI001CCF95BD|nr:adenylate/guanylate cyclase domain-containing protein [Kovacikia minuta]UBF23783.1 adenylate/guanylate cyclase domain-containing protein [Kovacikia minuta CCNUW1]
MRQVYYLPDDRLIEPGQESFTLLDVSLEAGIPHTHVCGGNARCSTCRVLVTEGLEYCSPRNLAEQALAQRLNFTPEVRLACQTEIVCEGKIALRRLSLDAHDIGMFHDEAFGKVAPSFKGLEQQIAILFADIRGFTSFSEALLPYDVIYVLDRYFQLMNQEIQRHGGIINVYMGDGLMALFGIENPDRAVERAVRAGLDMLDALERLNPSLEALYHHRLRIGIGIHYGNTVIGTIGDPKNPKWTAISDAVNLASRIETANKTLGTTLLISEDAYNEVKDQVVVNQSFLVKIPGKSGEYKLYEAIGASPVMGYKQEERSPLPAQPPTLLQRWMLHLRHLIRKFLR